MGFLQRFIAGSIVVLVGTWAHAEPETNDSCPTKTVRLDAPGGVLAGAKVQAQDGLAICYANSASLLLQAKLKDHPEVSALDLALNNLGASGSAAIQGASQKEESRAYFEFGRACQIIEQTRAKGSVCSRAAVAIEEDGNIDPAISEVIRGMGIAHDDQILERKAGWWSRLDPKKIAFLMRRYEAATELAKKECTQNDPDDRSQCERKEAAKAREALSNQIKSSKGTDSAIKDPIYSFCGQEVSFSENLQAKKMSRTLSNLGLDTQKAIELLETASLPPAGASARDYYRKLITQGKCSIPKNSISIPRTLSCSHKGFPSGFVKGSFEHTPKTLPQAKSAFFDHALRTLDNGKGQPTSLSLCGAIFYDTHYDGKNGVSGCTGGDKRLGVHSNHEVALIGYRTRKDSSGQCVRDYLIQNSWGESSCMNLGERCENGKVWFSEDTIVKNTYSVSNLN